MDAITLCCLVVTERSARAIISHRRHWVLPTFAAALVRTVHVRCERLPWRLTAAIPYVSRSQIARSFPPGRVPSAHAPNNALLESISCVSKGKTMMLSYEASANSNAHPNAQLLRPYSKNIFLCSSGTCRWVGDSDFWIAADGRCMWTA